MIEVDSENPLDNIKFEIEKIDDQKEQKVEK